MLTSQSLDMDRRNKFRTRSGIPPGHLSPSPASPFSKGIWSPTGDQARFCLNKRAGNVVDSVLSTQQELKISHLQERRYLEFHGADRKNAPKQSGSKLVESTKRSRSAPKQQGRTLADVTRSELERRLFEIQQELAAAQSRRIAVRPSSAPSSQQRAKNSPPPLMPFLQATKDQ